MEHMEWLPVAIRELEILCEVIYLADIWVNWRIQRSNSIFHFAFAIIVCFIGLLTMAFMIGEFANLFISYIGNEVDYQKNHIAVEMYLGRWKISGELKARTQAFLSSLWSSHRGVDYQSFLEGVPACIRTDSILFIAQAPLRSFVNDVFVPLPRAEELDIANKLIQDIAQHLKFEGYPRGENVLVEGSITRSMYFVVRGHLFSTSTSQSNRDCSFAKGTYFGDKGLLGCSVSICTIRTLRACDLLSLSPDALLCVLQGHRVTNLAYEIAAHAVQIVKARDCAASNMAVGETEWGEAILGAIRQKHKEIDDTSPNPDKPLADELDHDNAVRAHNKAVKMISAFVALERSIDAFGILRPMLQLIVPNGQLHNFSGVKGELLPLINTKRGVEFTSIEQEALTIIRRLFQKKDNAIVPEPTVSDKSSGVDVSKSEKSFSGTDDEKLVQDEMTKLIPPPMIDSISGRKSSLSQQLPPKYLPELRLCPVPAPNGSNMSGTEQK
ncbi:hypothetical protein BBO99_00001887 [Phytophthora kernoviae]|uniref:Cyclic nucleotide-binding domain-containing protein n=2 Tax=Phytophthora kernoviae TaxID=325452 RepID=A0A3R7H6X0_9STRA|nr:hypothetical protein G195_001164 [Phytophthora kernoviae 00238/432]KAG2529233.1 hypothetical protein JM18_001739 [Phytophthora kernoviae]KAG2530009.1 hypothetical protein JM16_001689 [Phytophthora kernoviae]RLN26983.1 hypothetical protein BBI17_001744 [Phytophthora kernoviae]RLN83666.1 hypothetical protein BBO99_00001887 [Phytophthora kernoviae]